MSDDSVIKTHELKTWPAEYDAVMAGKKTFDVRAKDRDFKVGDYLTLKKYDPEKKEYTGDVCAREIKYILEGGKFGIQEGYVAMSIA